jgi:hypothetical protein
MSNQGLSYPGQPGIDAAEVTPSDADNLATQGRALWVGTAGDVKVTTSGGSVVTFQNVPAGTLLPISVKKVWATGTGASDIVNVY